MNIKTRQISEGAMMVALVGVVLIMNQQTANILEDASYWVLSFPILLYSAKYGFKTSIIPAFSCMVIGLMFGTPKTMFYLTSALCTGILYGTGVKLKWKNQTLLILVLIVEFVTLFITTVVFAAVFGFDLLKELKQIQEMVQQVGIKELSDNLAIMAIVITYIGTSVLQSLVIHLLGHRLLKRFKIDVRKLKSVFDVCVPKWVAYFIVITFVLNMIAQFKMFSPNITLWIFILYSLFFIVGIIDGLLSVLCILINENKVKYFIFVIILALIPLLQNIIYVFGVYDIFIGFRKNIERR